MNTQQEIIEREVRMLIGDLHLQLVMARARIAELEQAMPNPSKMDGRDSPLPNGQDQPQEAAAP